MTLANLDPFTLVRDFDRIVQSAFRSEHEVARWAPRVDVFDREEALVVRAEVAGVDPDSLDITVEGGELAISGSRSFEHEESKSGYRRKEIFEGEFHRTIMLPDGLDLDAVKASSRDGVLEVTIPRLPEVLPKKVKVEIER